MKTMRRVVEDNFRRNTVRQADVIGEAFIPDGNEKGTAEGESRASAAKELQEKWKERGVKYSSDKDKRTFSEDAKFADCASFVCVSLKKAGQNDIFTEKNAFTGKGGTQAGDSMQKIIYELSFGKSENKETYSEEELKKPYRSNDPKLGDIMMWRGHVAIVAEIISESKKFRFAHMIYGGADLSGKSYDDYITYADKDKMIQRIADYSGRKDFWGFWTPPIQIKN